MSFLGGIGKALGGIVKQVAPAILRAVAPSVSEGLKKITDGFISGGANALKGLVSGLPSPIASLLNKGIDWGSDKLQGLAGKAFDDLRGVGVPRAEESLDRLPSTSFADSDGWGEVLAVFRFV